jgi:hypothetical protein
MALAFFLCAQAAFSGVKAACAQMAPARSAQNAADFAPGTSALTGASVASGASAATQNNPAAAAQNASAVLDRVIVAVNQQPILQSDLDREIRLAVLNPNLAFSQRPSPAQALDRLISRTLIEQQLAGQPLLPEEQIRQSVEQRMSELRAELPACARLNCKTPQGWQAFLQESKLTEAEVESFLRLQAILLDFIGRRFRPGIRITRSQITAYYNESLLPQYSNPALAPPLENVSQRIAEVLLEQEVNRLLDDWLATLRKEGDLEFLDRSFEPQEESR